MRRSGEGRSGRRRRGGRALHAQLPAGGGPSTNLTRYFVSDHLGSVAVVTDEAGTVLERLSYDAWGKYRLPNGQDDPTCSVTSSTTKGYTGHETIAEACLINMNARVYDPQVGRFLSPDSIVPNPFNAQSFNRYAYVHNGPLSATDPSGHYAPCDTTHETAHCGNSAGWSNFQVQAVGGCTFNGIECMLVTPDEWRRWLPNLEWTFFRGARAFFSDSPSFDILSMYWLGDLSQWASSLFSQIQTAAVPLSSGSGANNTAQTQQSTAGQKGSEEALEDKYGGDNFGQTEDSNAYSYTGAQDSADKQAAKAWEEDRLSDGTELHLQGYSNETGFYVSSEKTQSVPSKSICVRCSDGLHEGTQFNYDSIPEGAYPAHSHTLRQGNLPGPGDQSGVSRFDRAYVLTPQGAFAAERTYTGYRVRQIAGDQLVASQIRALNQQIQIWNQPGGAQCRPVSCM